MEIETKIKTNDLEGLKKKLEEMGAEFWEPVVQEDDFFKQKGKEMETQRPGSFILRIRKQGKKAFLTFKALTETTGAWVEHETAIDNPNEMSDMLDKIGFSKVLTITKERTTGKLGEFGVCIDKVNDLGNYVEFEIISNDVESGKKKIDELFKKLNISEDRIEHRGYAAIFFQNMGVKFEGTQG